MGLDPKEVWLANQPWRQSLRLHIVLSPELPLLFGEHCVCSNWRVS